jgi:hypothetical protein
VAHSFHDFSRLHSHYIRVERFEVHAPDKSSGKRCQEIDVYVNFVGRIDIAELSLAGKPEPQAKAGGGENGAAGSPKALYLLYENA